MKNGKAILGIAAGIAAGAAIGMMFAPDKGRQTRKKMMKSVEDLASAIDNRIEQKFSQLELKIYDLIKGIENSQKKTGA